KPRQPWVTNNILDMINKKKRLWKKHINNPSNAILKLKYFNYNKKVNAIINKAKDNYALNKMEEIAGNTKQEYDFMREYANLPNKSSSETQLDKIFNDCQVSLSNKFNSYFVNIGSTISNNILTTQDFTPYTYNTSEEFSFSHTTACDMFREISSVKLNKSVCGEIKPKILKRYRSLLCPTLVHIFNRCIDESVFPLSLKSATVLPVYKSGETDNIS